MTRKIIGLCGFINCGKSTVSNILVEEHGFTKISYADRLKDTVATMFDWDRDLVEGVTPESRIWRETPDEYWSNELGYPVTPRLIMQRVGTDCMRKGLDKQVWILFVKKTIMSNPNTNYVVSDIRFFNERNLVRSLGGEVWEIKRGLYPDWVNKAISDNRYETSWMIEHPDIHESEWRWLDYPSEFNRTILNDSDYQFLQNQINQFL